MQLLEHRRPRAFLIDEASAAALGYGAFITPGDVYLIFDFGGGTLDVAVVLIEEDPSQAAHRRCRVLGKAGAELGFEVDVRQTDDEAELVGWLHEAADDRTPVVLNPAAFTHYSYALRDAIAQRTAPLIEIHLTNPATREDFRHTSVVAGVATGTIAGHEPCGVVVAVAAAGSEDAAVVG